MHSQTDQTERPMRAGHDEKLASRAGSGGMARSGESPDASTISRDDSIVWDMAVGTTLFAIHPSRKMTTHNADVTGLAPTQDEK